MSFVRFPIRGNGDFRSIPTQPCKNRGRRLRPRRPSAGRGRIVGRSSRRTAEATHEDASVARRTRITRAFVGWPDRWVVGRLGRPRGRPRRSSNLSVVWAEGATGGGRRRRWSARSRRRTGIAAAADPAAPVDLPTVYRDDRACGPGRVAGRSGGAAGHGGSGRRGSSRDAGRRGGSDGRGGARARCRRRCRSPSRRRSEPPAVTEPPTRPSRTAHGHRAGAAGQEPATAPIPVVTAAGAGTDGYAVVSSPQQTPVSEPAPGAGGASDTEMPPRMARGAVSILVIGGAGPLRDAVASKLAAHGAAVVLHTDRPRRRRHQRRCRRAQVRRGRPVRHRRDDRVGRSGRRPG